MSRPSKVSASASVVVRGSLDPGRLTPSWLHREGLLAQDEAEMAEIEVIFRDVVKFAADMLQFEATHDRLVVRAPTDLESEPMKDISIGVLRKLPGLRVTKLGINHDRRYAFTNADAWHALGHSLAPQQLWQGVLDEPGMLALHMQGTRSDGQRGYVRVRVEAFVDAQTPFGVVVDVNDHLDVERDGSPIEGPEAADVVQATWRDAAARSVTITEKVLGL